LRWTSIWTSGPMQCKKFIILINLCVKFSYFILTQNIILIIPVKAVLTILYSINAILLTASSNCKNQLTACFKLLVATALQCSQCLWDSPLPYFKYITLYFCFYCCCCCCLLHLLLLQFYEFTFEHDQLQNNCSYNDLNQLNFKYFCTLHPKYPKVNMYEQ